MKRTNIPYEVRLAVLTEAGYRCAVPNCRAILAIDLHHIVPIANEGTNDPKNLVALCPTCHALYHRGTIPLKSIRAWKESLSKGSCQANTIMDQQRPVAQSRKTILFIDDDTNALNIVTEYLESDGYKVVPVGSADAAVDEVITFKYDVIVLDIMMPPPRDVARDVVRDGYETGIYLASRIKDSINHGTPIIVLSAILFPRVRAEMFKIGIAEYLRKPCSMEELEEAIQRALA